MKTTSGSNKVEDCIEDEIAFLKECADLYETNGSSSISDYEYDKRYDGAKALLPDNPFFKGAGGISKEHVYGTEVKHEHIMGSLEKSPNTDDFTEWFSKTFPDTTGLEIILEPKIDGSSITNHYEGGKHVLTATRGDGEIGFDVTANAKHVGGIPKKIKSKEEVEIKGEAYKNRQDFYENWVGEYKNPRNFTSGAMNQKKSSVTKERGISFVAYEVRGIDFATEEEKSQFLKDNGFENLIDLSLKIDCSGLSAKEVAAEIQTYMDGLDRDGLHFELDGVVVKVNNIPKAEAMGTTDGGKRPKANRAVKFPCEQKETKLLGVEWKVKRTGRLTCTALLEPVELAQTTVARATLHNPKFIKEMGLEKNCTILLQKSGEIIPYILKKTQDGDNPIEIPSECPSCGGDMKWDKNDVSKWCHYEECSSRVVANIEYWFKTLNVKGIGSRIIERLNEEETNSEGNQLVASIADMYNLEHYRAELAESFGEKAFDNIVKAVNSVKEITLTKFVHALGISKIGSMAADIVAIAPTIEDLNKLSVGQIAALDGFAETKAKSFVDTWADREDEITELLKYITIIEDVKAGNALEGQKYCFTGSFKNPSRKEMEQSVVDHGGKKSSVGKSLTALVWDGSEQGSKLKKAQELGLPIISQEEFLERL